MNQPTKGKKAAKQLLSEALEYLAGEMHTITPDGKPITKAEALALDLWNQALGYTELDPKNELETKYPPSKWAIQEILDRIVGKVTPTIETNESGDIPIAERVSDVGTEFANNLAQNAVKNGKSLPDKTESP